MSDCFDHALEAFESRFWGNHDTPTTSNSYEDYDSDSNFKYDKNYYHVKVKAKIVKETEKAFLLKNKKGVFWVAKSLCRKVKRKSLLIHKSAKFKYLKLIDLDKVLC